MLVLLKVWDFPTAYKLYWGTMQTNFIPFIFAVFCTIQDSGTFHKLFVAHPQLFIFPWFWNGIHTNLYGLLLPRLLLFLMHGFCCFWMKNVTKTFFYLYPKWQRNSNDQKTLINLVTFLRALPSWKWICS